MQSLICNIDDAQQIEQVLSSRSSISMLSKPCAVCQAQLRSQCDDEGKSDSSRNSSRRGSSNIQSSHSDGSRRNSVALHNYGGNADHSSTLPSAAHQNSPVPASPDNSTISGHTIIASSLRSCSRSNVGVQACGWLMHVDEHSVASDYDSLQVIISVKDR
jgi:hypothetical protein